MHEHGVQTASVCKTTDDFVYDASVCLYRMRKITKRAGHMMTQNISWGYCGSLSIFSKSHSLINNCSIADYKTSRNLTKTNKLCRSRATQLPFYEQKTQHTLLTTHHEASQKTISIIVPFLTNSTTSACMDITSVSLVLVIPSRLLVLLLSFYCSLCSSARPRYSVVLPSVEGASRETASHHVVCSNLMRQLL